jgi:outer membrane protein assembly factor BamB
MAEEQARRRPPPPRRPGRFTPQRRRRLLRTLAILTTLVVVVALLVSRSSGGPARDAAGRAQAGHKGSAVRTTRRPSPSTTTTDAPSPYLSPGSDPGVLPGPVLIADHLNNRLVIVSPEGRITWEFPGPGDVAPGQTFLVPDDAFFTPSGKQIVATEEDDDVISLIDVATHRIVWQYGTPGQSGSGPNQLSHPDDAMMLPDGDIITADIKNCRVLILKPGLQVPLAAFGSPAEGCFHDPPAHWGSPNGAFPMRDGHYLVTEINGDWVDELGLDGQVYLQTHPPGVLYPSDTNEVSSGVYLTADYSDPGQIETFNAQGQLLWRYSPSGAQAMNKPSLALPLPNGDILCNDDYNDRVIVVDPATDAVVWQYGHSGQAGSAPGYLDDPDGVDLVPPFSFDIIHASTMGLPPGP